MATIREMIETHNDLARTLDQPELTTWKQAGEKLQARIDAMRELIEADAELDAAAAEAEADANAADQALLDSALDGSLMASLDPLALPLDTEAPGHLGEVGPDTVSPNGPEEPGDDHGEPVEHPGKVGVMIAELLVDPEAYDYQEIVDIVRGQFPNAKTSRRSIASVAAALRRKAIEVPMRRKAHAAKA